MPLKTEIFILNVLLRACVYMMRVRLSVAFWLRAQFFRVKRCVKGTRGILPLSDASLPDCCGLCNMMKFKIGGTKNKTK